MCDCQTRQKYEWIPGGCKEILESPNISKFYYSETCVKIGRRIDLGVVEQHIRVRKNDKIYTPHFACGAVYITGLGVGIYELWIKLPVGKHLNPEIRLVNMFGENRTAFQVLKGYTESHNGYKRFFKKQCRIFSYMRNNKDLSNMYVHERGNYHNGVNGGLAHIRLVVTGDCVIMQMNNKTVLTASKVEAKDAIEDLNRVASLAMVFALNVDSDYKDGNLKEKFKIVSFDFMPLHKIDDAIDK